MNTLQLLRKNRTKIYKLATKYGVAKIQVFGSTSRGEENEDSDIDLLIKVTDYSKYCQGFGRTDFEEELKKILHRKIDVVTEKSLHPLLKNEITNTAISL